MLRRNKIKTSMAIALVAMAFASCGQKHRAKALVEDFLSGHLANQRYSDLSVSAIDSTFYITPAAIKRMQEDFNADKTFGKPATFASAPSKKLLFVRAQYVNGQDTVGQTFYFDDQLTKVVACKNY